MTTNNFSCQENLLPGNSIIEKWHNAQKLGFNAIELRSEGKADIVSRLPELLEAKKQGAFFSTICVITDHFIGDFHPEKRLSAINNMKGLLSAIGALEGVGAITPASYGMHSNYLPPFNANRTAKEDRSILLDGLGELGNFAQKEGVKLLFEPLNRYEDHMVNTLSQGVSLCQELNLDSVKIMADVFHMNIEEINTAQALINAKDYVAHIHLADSQRLEPGQGHIDFSPIFNALDVIGYSGYLAYECMLSENTPAIDALNKSVEYLKRSKLLSVVNKK